MDSATTVLLTFQESPIKDECGNEWVAAGNPTIDAEHSKFGSALQLDGSSYIETANTIPLGTNSFTIDFWLYIDEGAPSASLVNITPNFIRSSFNCYDDWGENAPTPYTSLTYGNPGGSGGQMQADMELRGQLTHVAIIHSDIHFDYENEDMPYVTTLFLFFNGVLQSIRAIGDQLDRNNLKLTIGSGLKGAISEFRVSDGIARWIVDSNGTFVRKLKYDQWDSPSSGYYGYYLDEYIYIPEWDDYDDVQILGSKWFEPPSLSYLSESSQQIEHAVFDTSRRLLDTATADTRRHIVKGFEHATFNTLRHMFEGTSAGTIRALHKKEYVRADIMRQIPVSLNDLASFTENEIIEFSVTLQEHTLSDRFEVRTCKDFDIGQSIKGRLFNYDFSFLVESVHEEHGIKTLTGMYDQDRLLYTQIYPQVLINPITNEPYGRGSKIQVLNPSDPSSGETVDSIYAGASYFVTEIAKAFGLTPVIFIRDFLPTQDFTSSNVTYRDIISSLFSWTSRVPRKLVNVAIRGDYLYCVQRGSVEGIIDISNLSHTEPIIDKSIVRSVFNSSLPDNGFAEEDVMIPFSGILYFRTGNEVENETSTVRYIQGFLSQETHEHNATGTETYLYSKSITSYTYKVIYPPNVEQHDPQNNSYLSSKSEKTTVQKKNTDDEYPIREYSSVSTTYDYSTIGDEIYLRLESEKRETQTYELRPVTSAYSSGTSWQLTDSDVTIRQTTHVPLGNGWYGTSVTENGSPKGSTISQGSPSNRVSPYTVKAFQRTFNSTLTDQDSDADSDADSDSDTDSDSDVEFDEDLRKRLAPIDDTSFPVEDEDYLEELTNEIFWMNRKTYERVQTTLVTKVVNGVPEDNQIIDFHNKVQLDGKIYFLSSNEIRLTPRSLTQKLTLVRWY